MKIAAEGRGFSPAFAGHLLTPGLSPACGRGRTRRGGWVRGLAAGLKPRPSRGPRSAALKPFSCIVVSRRIMESALRMTGIVDFFTASEAFRKSGRRRRSEDYGELLIWTALG
jgi:hypothetical protein